MPGKTALTKATYDKSVSDLTTAHRKFVADMTALYKDQQKMIAQLREVDALTRDIITSLKVTPFDNAAYQAYAKILQVLEVKGESLVTSKEAREAQGFDKAPDDSHFVLTLNRIKADLESLNLPLQAHNEEVAILLEVEQHFVQRESAVLTYGIVENKLKTDFNAIAKDVSVIFAEHEKLNEKISKRQAGNDTLAAPSSSTSTTQPSSVSGNKMSQFATPSNTPDTMDDSANKPKKGRGSRGCTIL